MLEPIPTVTIPSPVPSANEILAYQITLALRANDFIASSEEEDALTLLTAGSAKAGDWLRLFEKNVLSNSTPTALNYASTHQPT